MKSDLEIVFRSAMFCRDWYEPLNPIDGQEYAIQMGDVCRTNGMCMSCKWEVHIIRLGGDVNFAQVKTTNRRYFHIFMQQNIVNTRCWNPTEGRGQL